jgi:hypothetical protein
MLFFIQPSARLALLLPLFFAAFSARGQDLGSLEGAYRREPIENGWHEGRIVVGQQGGQPSLRWKNKAGKEWGLSWAGAGVLRTDSSNPYYESGAREFRLRMQNGKVIGFTFQDDFFVKEGVSVLAQKTGGFHGYISAQVEPPPREYGYGTSFYVSIWPLVSDKLSRFQIGLPSTWIIPDNRDFEKPLCPPGTVARDNWPERGPYYREVFQTIEGGLGYWVSTQFKSVNPKYRMNATPNGYNHEISSPGWGFGKTTALEPRQMGIAQLSNRLLVPPDGLTFEDGANGKVLGNAWMVLPFTKQTEGPSVPTGNQSWTLFLNSQNFKGPVAFFIPQTWSRLSQGYPTIVGRGLDARPGLMGSGAMEVNTVPYFEAKDRSGTTYTRIPKIQFPTDSEGVTRLMQDITFYTKGAVLSSGSFDPDKAWKPSLSAVPIRFHQGKEKVPLAGFDKHVETAIYGTPGTQSFGLSWTDSKPGFTSLPEYFKQVGRHRIAVSADEVPAETKLREQEFMVIPEMGSYTSPGNGIWTTPGPASKRMEVALNDGSVVTYAWYRFVDQPSLRSFSWTAEEKNRLQKLAEMIHAKWPVENAFMPEPSSGQLVALDRGVIVSAPVGLEVGYVPIALSQRSASGR